MSDAGRGDRPPDDPLEHLLPLRDRMPDYLAVWGLWGAVAVVVGFLVGLFTEVSLLSGVSYTIILLGVVWLLAGGASGGGYTNLGMGAVGALFGARAGRPDEDLSDPEVRRGKRAPQDPMERLRKGLRPGPNPRAFWQVIGGFAYIAVGMVLLIAFGS